MPLGLNGIELLRYFRQPENAFGKSIQRNWQFWGFFIYNPLKGIGLGRGLEFPPVIQPFHILSVNIPTYNFKKEKMMYGQVPRTFPVLDFEGFDLEIELEEDEQGTVEYFINWNQRNIITKEGYYNAPNDAKIKAFVLEVQDKKGFPVIYYTFHGLFFLQASPVNYTYNGNESIKRTVTFGCDRMSTVFTKQNILARGVGLISGIAGGIQNAVAGSRDS
jgi:hypothetical protein